MSADILDALLAALVSEGFTLPHSARVSDYANFADLHRADREAEQQNREALRNALRAVHR